MQTAHRSYEIHLVSRPKGEPRLTDFEVVEATVPDPGPGEVLVRNRFLSVDPYMRGRMRDAASYTPPFALGAVMTGMAVGEVVASQSADLAAGDLVVHDLGWRSTPSARRRRFAACPQATRRPAPGSASSAWSASPPGSACSRSRR